MPAKLSDEMILSVFNHTTVRKIFVDQIYKVAESELDEDQVESLAETDFRAQLFESFDAWYDEAIYSALEHGWNEAVKAHFPSGADTGIPNPYAIDLEENELGENEDD